MSTTTAPPQTTTMPSQKQQFLDAFEQEQAKTMRVLRAYPREKLELQPHAKCKTARELAWMFVVEQGAIQQALTTGFDWSKPPVFPPAPDSFDAILGALDQGHARITGLVAGLRDEDLFRAVQFFTEPGKVGDMVLHQFLSMVLCDQIHHRGQFSIYLRMADGRVPSIYGPSLDEPWY